MISTKSDLAQRAISYGVGTRRWAEVLIVGEGGYFAHLGAGRSPGIVGGCVSHCGLDIRVATAYESLSAGRSVVKERTDRV